MKEESVLNVLMYLFRNHLQENLEPDESESSLIFHLEEVGFERKAIIQAFEWLENLHEQTHTPISLSTDSLRIYTAEECQKINPHCRGLLTYLEQEGILKPHTREMVINQTLELEIEGIDASLIKWVTLLVLFNQPEDKEALACMEFLVLDDTIDSIH